MSKKLKLCGRSNSSVNSQLLMDPAIFLSELIKIFNAKTTDRGHTKWCIFHYLSRTDCAITVSVSVTLTLEIDTKLLHSAHRFLMVIICTKLFFKNFSTFKSYGADTKCSSFIWPLSVTLTFGIGTWLLRSAQQSCFIVYKMITTSNRYNHVRM